MKPNVLILMADELRFDVPGFMGNRICRTPSLDALAKESVIFDSAYTASPVCIPARQCLATGKYPFRIGCEKFGQDIQPGAMTFARRFSEAGYHTVACGKLHHRGPDQMQGWLQRIGAETAVDWPQTAEAAGREQIGRLKWRGAEELRLAGAGDSPQAIHDRYSVDGALAFLRMHFGGMYDFRGASPPPVLMLVSLQQPHFPFLAAQELLDYYLPRVHARIHEEVPRHPVLSRGALPCGIEADESDIRRATAAYYGMAEQADRELGRILAGLEAAGEALDDWIVVFTGDHGDMLGEHGLWGKRKFFEGSARIPLFVRWPRRFAPGRRWQNVNIVDLFPTLCDLAGIAVAEDLDGRSLLPLVQSRKGRWVNETFSQFEEDEFMLKQGNLKYLHFGSRGPDVLFDLASDPGETTNRITEAAYSPVADRLRTRLLDFTGAPSLASHAG